MARAINTPAASADRTPRHYTHIRYKFNGPGWYDDRCTHLWVIDARTGKDQQITSGDGWNDTDPQWSPDSARIAFVSDRTGKEHEGGHNKDVFVIAAAGGALAKISDHEFEDDQPRWSPDGKKIAFAGKVKRDQDAKIYIADSDGGKPAKMIAPELDLIPGNLNWIAPGEIRFDTGYKGQSHMFKVDVATGRLTQVTTGDRSVHGFDVNQKAGVMEYLSNEFEHMDDIRVAALDGSGERKITDVNSRLWEELDLAHVERLSYKSSDGWQVDGFLAKPVNFDPSRKYPMILMIHGGPGGQYGITWFQEAQIYASKGWAVFFCNPRGSTGYGQKFELGIKNNYGGMDYQDVMSGVDAAIKQNPWVDTARLAVTGGSYGGYLTNWIVSHTDRFRVAAADRSVSNFLSLEGTRDGAYGHDEYFGGVLFDSRERFWDASPLKYVKNVKTPILLIEAEIVFFPRENHGLTATGEPRHLVDALKWHTWWFDRYLEGINDAKAPDMP